MRITRRTGSGFLGVVLLAVTALWSLLKFQHLPLSTDDETLVAPAVPVVNVERAPSSSLPSSPESVRARSESGRQLAILTEMLSQGRDDDPRFDTDLRTLAPDVRKILREKYTELPSEKRNHRGTLIFLIGRNLESTADFTFLGDVLKESPCLSLSDCTRGEDFSRSHHSSGIAVTLAYPQLVALDALGSYLDRTAGKGIFAEDALALLETGSQSKVSVVSRLAHRLRERHPRAIARREQSQTAF